MKFDVATRSQVVSLRRAGMTVAEIADRLNLNLTSHLDEIRRICDELPRKFQFGELGPRGPVARTRGARR
jgi:hypothetical protein